jgi:alpha-L-rhamnosidase
VRSIRAFSSSRCVSNFELPAIRGKGGLRAHRRPGEELKNPPDSAKPRAWRHWLNRNVIREGIVADLDRMRGAIAGMQVFDGNLSAPQSVDQRPIGMTPPGQAARRYVDDEPAAFSNG